MPCKIIISTPLLRYVKGEPELLLTASTIKEALTQLWQRFPELKKRICNEQGAVKENLLNIYINDTDIRTLAGIETEIKDGDEVFLIPIIVGG